jgi:hypothetical protein
MKEHNQSLLSNIENLTSFSKKMRIISRIYKRGPPEKCSGREKKKLDATGCNNGHQDGSQPCN